MRTRLSTVLALAIAMPVAAAGPAMAASSPHPSQSRAAVTGAAPATVQHLPTAGPSGRVTLDVQLPLRDAAKAEKLALAVSTPGSTRYGKFLSPAQFNKRFAPSRAQVERVRRFVTKAGLTVVDVPGNNRYVEVSGTVSQVNSLFHVRLRTSHTQGRSALVADRRLTVPAAVKPDILTVTGLEGVTARPGIRGTGTHRSTSEAQSSDRMSAKPVRPAARHTIDTPCSNFWGQHTATMPTAYEKDGFPTAVCGYNADQLQAAYGVQGLEATGTTGRGTTVAIVDSYNLSTMKKDANTYARKMGQPVFATGQYQAVLPKKFSHQEQCGADDWHSEQVLDVETVHGVAPGANIRYVAGKDCSYNGLIKPLNKIVNRHLADIVSNSWGFFGESTIPTSTISATHAVLVQAAAEGIGMYFCTLDNGDEASMVGSAQAVYPASDPMVTAVGGTTLGVGADGRRVLEAGWGNARATVKYDANGMPDGYVQSLPGNFYIGGGGGTSTVFRQPAYQKGVVPSGLARQYGGKAMRVEPDLAADADPYTGYEIGYTIDGTFQEMSYGGTSLATPIIASMISLASQGRATPIGFANPLLYSTKVQRSIRDILPTRAPVAMAFTSNLDTSGCYESCLITTDRDTSLHTAYGFDDVTGLGTPKGASFIRKLHRG